VALCDAGKRHASAPEALPERQRRVIEVFGGRIVGSSDSRLDLLSSRNRTHYNYITSSGTFVKPSDRLPPLDYSSSPGRSSGSCRRSGGHSTLARPPPDNAAGLPPRP